MPLRLRRVLVRLAAVALTAPPALSATAAAATTRIAAHGGAEQVYATGLPPQVRAMLANAHGRIVARRVVDAEGAVLFAHVKPGAGYRVRLRSSGEGSASLRVHSEAAAPWDPRIYRQRIRDDGYQYLSTRDGTKLAIYVHPPSHPAGISSLPNGITLPGDYLKPPYPTVIEYSGYGYADPHGPDSGIATLANLMGFAVVDVNMRGTGCSGGAFSYFEPQQNLDGYDVIQTIARQPWVLGHRVGMIGISYGAISQLFTAQLDPPALEAIAPLSTIDSTMTTLYPGGILNTGFALGWAAQRQVAAEPAGLTSGQPWAFRRIQQGDRTCLRNQALHAEAPSVLRMIRDNSHYVPAVADPLDPVTFVHRIKAAVFMACQWEDEQTGGHCADLAQDFTGTAHKWFTFTNGAHIDSLDPATFDRWYDFLSLFVAHRAPIQNAGLVELAAPLFYAQAMGIQGLTLPADPIQQMPGYRSALAAYEALPSVRVLFDNGAGRAPNGTITPGDPYPAFEQSFSSWPIPGTTAQTWYLGPGGSLAQGPDPGATGPLAGSPGHTPEVDSFRWDASALPATDFPSDELSAGGLWGNAADWAWNWQQNPSGTAVSYVSAPLALDTTVIGGGAVHLWIQASAPSVDLQATVSEVRPDGMETFVQDGWARADERRLMRGSTLLQPVLDLSKGAVAPLQPGIYDPVTIPLYYEGHVYRAGSRIRVTISAPGGTQPSWAFAQTSPSGTAKVRVQLLSSNLVLPVVGGVQAPTALPPCPSLRNEPCRPYVPLINSTSAS